MKLLIRYCALVAGALCTSTAFAVAPQRTFVASTGNDADPCTVIAPCRGFQAAINAVMPGGEVVALDSAGYGAMEIHKSVSVIVPPGVHAGLSPLAGIPLPGFPGQSTVVLIDIQDTDTVVLRGLNVNHQGTVTGGIDWLSANGGIVHVENTTVNGFPNEGLFMGAPNGKMFVKDSIFRNNGYGIYIRAGVNVDIYFFGDRLRIEHSTWGLTTEGSALGSIRDSMISAGSIGIYATGGNGNLSVDRCTLSYNQYGFKMLNGTTIWVSASTLYNTVAVFSPRNGFLYSLGNNSVSDGVPIFNTTYPLQ